MRFSRKPLLAVITATGLLAIFTVWLRTPVDAQGLQQNRAGTAPKTLAPGQINTEYSRVYIHVGKTGLGHEHAVEGHIQEGAIHFGAPKDVGQMVFDMTSFSADTPTARKVLNLEGATDASTQAKVNANMHGPEVLDVEHFRTASYEIRNARLITEQGPRGVPQWEFSGDFTLHGVKRPLRILVDVRQEKGWSHIRGQFSILQSEYGIKPFRKAFGAIGVADRLNIYGDLWVAPELVPQ